MEEFIKIFTEQGSKLNLWQTSLRALIIFILTIFILKAGKKKFLGKNSTLDFVLAIIVGSVISRSINGSANLLNSVSAGLVLMLFHSFLSYLTVRSKKFSVFLDGKADILLEDGKLKEKLLKQHHINKEEIMEAARLKAQINEIIKIDKAFLESNGSISIIKKEG